jgi:hypothetical protein
MLQAVWDETPRCATVTFLLLFILFRVLTRFRDFAVQRRQTLPDGRGSVMVVLIQRELQSRDR